MRVCKAFEPDGKLNITGSNNILNLEVLAFAMRKYEHKGYKLQKTTPQNQPQRERETESIDTLNLAANPSFWIIRAYWKTKFSY